MPSYERFGIRPAPGSWRQPRRAATRTAGQSHRRPAGAEPDATDRAADAPHAEQHAAEAVAAAVLVRVRGHDHAGRAERRCPGPRRRPAAPGSRRPAAGPARGPCRPVRVPHPAAHDRQPGDPRRADERRQPRRPSSAVAGSCVSTTNAATSIGPSTKTNSNSEVSAAIAAAAQADAGRCRRRSCRSRPGGSRRSAAGRSRRPAPRPRRSTAARPRRPATSSRPTRAERMQHGGGQQHRRRADPVGEPARDRAERGAGQRVDATGQAGRRVPAGGLLDQQQQRQRRHADAEPGQDADDQAGPGRRASATRRGTDATRPRSTSRCTRCDDPALASNPNAAGRAIPP